MEKTLDIYCGMMKIVTVTQDSEYMKIIMQAWKG